MSFCIKRTSYPIETGQQVAATEGYLIGTLTYAGLSTLTGYSKRNADVDGATL